VPSSVVKAMEPTEMAHLTKDYLLFSKMLQQSIQSDQSVGENMTPEEGSMLAETHQAGLHGARNVWDSHVVVSFLLARSLIHLRASPGDSTKE
jgi:hypothetical protein